MHMRSLIAASFAALISLSLAAQNCANQRAKDVDGSIEYGPANTCTGLDLSYAGVRVTQAANKCPTFALIKPGHQIAEPHAGTRVDVVGAVNATLITFVCKRDYLLWIIPDGAQCVVDSVRVAYAVNLLGTRGC
jgi:hypothetical protein